MDKRIKLEGCNNSLHSVSGHYPVFRGQRPTWLYRCKVPSPDHSVNLKIKEICRVVGLECECNNIYNDCCLCCNITENNELVANDLTKDVKEQSFVSVEPLLKLFPILDFEKMSLAVAVEPEAPPAVEQVLEVDLAEFRICPTNLWDCSCRTEEEKKLFVWKYHYNYLCCKNARHADFPRDKYSHFVIKDRPVWYHSCFLPFTSDEKNLKVVKLTNYLGFECSCLPDKQCDLCDFILGCDKIQFANHSSLSLHILMKLDRFIKWEKLDGFAAEIYNAPKYVSHL